MENLDLKQMSTMVDIIAEEKGLPKDIVLNVIEQAIAAAWRKDNGDREMNVRAVLNTKTGEADVFVAREVIEDGLAYNPSNEIPLKEAGKGSKIGDIVEEKHKVTSFGRVAAGTAKQVVIQRLREAENDAVLTAFEDKIGTIVTGTVSRVEPKLVRIDLGRATGIMPRSEQIDGEYYTVGNRIKVLIKKIERGERGAQLILSRGSAEFVECLFRQEVPELENHTVEIKGHRRNQRHRQRSWSPYQNRCHVYRSRRRSSWYFRGWSWYPRRCCHERNRRPRKNRRHHLERQRFRIHPRSLKPS